MDILSRSNNTPNFNPTAFTTHNENVETEKEILINGNKSDEHVFRLNPLLNESLNNLVKRLERTKIPKPPPTKGQSIRKKSKLSNSLPNIFLPPGFDEHKYSNNEKKVQWSNKLNLNLERLKDAFSNTYSFWCARKRSLSVSNLIKDNIPVISSENCNVELDMNVDSINAGQKKVSDNEIMSNRCLNKFGMWNASNLDKGDQHAKITAGDNHDVSELEDIPSYSTHVYLDGAIIEPISPASPAGLVDQLVTVVDNSKKHVEQDQDQISAIKPDQNIKPLVRKKGRPKKIQNDIKTTINEPSTIEHESNANIEHLSVKSVKPTLKKKQKKSGKMNNKNRELPSFSSDNTDGTNTQLTEISEKPALSKKQKTLTKQKTLLSTELISTSGKCETIDGLKTNEIPEIPILTKKQKNLPRQSRSTKAKGQIVDFTAEADTTDNITSAHYENTQILTPSKKPKRLSKLNVSYCENVESNTEPGFHSDTIEDNCEKEISLKKYEGLSDVSFEPGSSIEEKANDSYEKPFERNLNERIEKPILTKKERKSSKQTKTNRKNASFIMETEVPSDTVEGSCDTPVVLKTSRISEKETLTKKQKQLLKRASSSNIEIKCDLKPDLIEELEDENLMKTQKELSGPDIEFVITNENIPETRISSKVNKTPEREGQIKKSRRLSKQNQSLEETQEYIPYHIPPDITNDSMVDLVDDPVNIMLTENPKEVGFILEQSEAAINIPCQIIAEKTIENVEAFCENPIVSVENKEIIKEIHTKSTRKLSKQSKTTESINKDLDLQCLSAIVNNSNEKVALESSEITKPEETTLTISENDLSEKTDVITEINAPSLSIEKDESLDGKSVIPKLKKRGPKKSRKGRPNQDHLILTEVDKHNDAINEVNETCEIQNDGNLISNVDFEEESIPVDNRRRLQRSSNKPNIDILSQIVETTEVPSTIPINESSKKGPKFVKPGPKCKKQLLKNDDQISQSPVDEPPISELPLIEKPKISQKLSKRGRLKQIISEEYNDIDIKKDLTEESTKFTLPIESLRVVVDEIPERLMTLRGDISKDSDILKPDLSETIDQTNDIEILSKSITDTVDTSMLPPRKRYKRLMYLDDSKPSSPKETDIIESIESVEVCPVASEDNEPKEEEDVQVKKASNCRPRLKRKKQNKTVDDIITDSAGDSTIVEELKDEVLLSKDEDIAMLSNEEIIEKPGSLKRSKREAAARGFANMVAMSLNNSSQSHDSSSDFNKKSTANKIDSIEDVSGEVTNNKIFKRPRKSTITNIGSSKNKGKLSKSFDFMDEVDDDVEELEPSKILTKKQKISKEKNYLLFSKENPPSPGDTIISNNSSSQDTTKYKKIRTNTYIEPKPLHWFQDVEKCGCKPSRLKHLYAENEKLKKSAASIEFDCTDNCLNRLTYTECNSKMCPCGDQCNNQKIRKLEWVTSLKVIDIQSKGRGVITTKLITAGTLITEYVGEVITERTFQERMINVYKDDAHHYCLHFDGEMLIDAYRSGSVARFVNHSCQPNCEIQKWMVNGSYRMCLFANEDIEPDTELTYDYNFCSFNTKTTQLCLCGAPNCRGFIGGRPRSEQSVSQKDRKKLFFAFGRTMSNRERVFVLRRAIFLVRGRILGRCRRLGIRRSKQTRGIKLPSTITEIKRRKAKKNQFLTQMSALNSIRSIRTRLLQKAQDNETLTRTAQLAQILRDLYNSLLEQKDPLNPGQQLVTPFINSLKRRKYPEFYSMVGQDAIVCLNQVYSRLLDGKYSTMMSFDQDILQMIQNIELYAGKQSNIGKCAEQIKPIYKDLKMNSIALYEALTDEMVDDKDKNKLLSNNLTQITNAIKSLSNSTDCDQNDSGSQPKNKKRKQGPAANVGSSRGRLERGAEVIKCVCGFLIEAGHVMVQCDRCFVWQHAYCMNVARSTELVDVTRMEPYYCHICLNIPTESLVREIPRHFVITDETVDGGNTLFWTLLHTDTSLLKIDDFVYIPSTDETNSSGTTEIIDLSQRTIMRIYSLWKDSNGQRWMEGGLFLRPYNSYLKSLSELRSTNSTSTNKRKVGTAMDLSTHKWHQQEVVYTDLTKILPLDVCVGRCHVLNNHTFRLGKPLIQNNLNSSIDDVYLCDWLINKSGEWSEIDPAYMKINTKPYCFERYTDAINNEISINNNEKFLRQYTTDELLKFDQGTIESCVNKNIKVKCDLNMVEKKLLRTQLFDKLITKLSEFAFDRGRKLPLSPPSSIGSQSAPPSRDASPLCEQSGSKSPLIHCDEYFHHISRKQLHPKKTATIADDMQASKIIQTSIEESSRKTISSEYSESSPKLIIVVEEDRVTKTNAFKFQEETSTNDDKSSDLVCSSPREYFEERSNPCSEIKYGDLLDLLKETVKSKSKPKPKSKSTKGSSMKLITKSKKKTVLKKNVLKEVSEISSVDDNWEPTRSHLSNSAPRRETRSRRNHNDSNMSEDKKVLDENNSGVLQDSNHDLEDNEDDGRKTCFVKLERMRVSKAEKNKQKKAEKNLHQEGSSHAPVSKTTSIVPLLSSAENKPDSSFSLDMSNSDHILQQATSAESFACTDDDSHNPNSSSVTCNNRSKRKKGVPKRIPFDFTFQQISNVTKSDESGTILTYDYEVVDLSSGKSSHTDKPDQTTMECQKIESPELLASLCKLSKPNLTASEARHITAANDFSSIENISSN